MTFLVELFGCVDVFGFFGVKTESLRSPSSIDCASGILMLLRFSVLLRLLLESAIFNVVSVCGKKEIKR